MVHIIKDDMDEMIETSGHKRADFAEVVREQYLKLSQEIKLLYA